MNIPIKEIYEMKNYGHSYLLQPEAMELIKDKDLAIAIGGDNYCYDKGRDFYELDNEIKEKGTKMTLVGCSIEPDEIPGELAEHLKCFDLIAVRETISYNALEENGLKNITLIPDSAFLLEKDELPLPVGWKDGDTIGLNFSPLSVGYSKNADAVYKSIFNLVEHIINNSESVIALISHVMIPNEEDAIISHMIYDRYKDTGRIIVIDDLSLNCMQIKGYIARCKMFIGARTHATIAAYSTYVPTVVLGYSIKAKGIAKDIFGTYENYVRPIQDLSDENYLINSYEWLLANLTGMRKHLQEFVPQYKEKALLLKSEIYKLLSLS
jgi:polysaccharide pyruvyl transferase WcaK-like protein